MEVRHIFVAGAGQLGSGIAQVAAQSGFRVTTRDITQELVQRGYQGIQGGLKRRVDRGEMTQAQMNEVMGRISPTTDLSLAKDADVVIEAVTEKAEVKGKLFAELDKICPPHTIFATNTTSIPITKLGSFTKRPEKVIGMHFIHPVPVIKVMEMVRGYLTSDETFQAAYNLAKALGRDPIRFARDYAGFGNTYETARDASVTGYAERCNEAVYALYEGRATVKEIDSSRIFAAGMGALAWMDFVGLDTMYNVIEILWEEYRNPKFAPCPLLRRMVEAGHLGLKTGVGFYDYSKARKAEVVSTYVERFLSVTPEQIKLPT